MDSISRAITDDSRGGTRAVDLFNAREAADYCGGKEGSVHINTISRWRDDGWLRYVWAGGVKRKRYFYTKDALDECLTLKGYANRIERENDSGNTDTVREN
jgi:hypothetical protein